MFAWRPPGESSGTADAPWCPGSVVSLRAKEPLVPGVLHRVRLAPSAVGWAGEQLDVTTPGGSPTTAAPSSSCSSTSASPTTTARPTRPSRRRP
ncbi:hypothetical protein OV079_42475 [Nannocystis pusilla]|uniref:Uncharacterized protein n=1 Tax=Nannocystis pusilla TaxID=889268 RepID=A0A9X3EXZ2_9BACT|nr:hypothetical protein [Nannocystis pusilla]MCY1012106.1 hypothetical protein [Nannocystis pusilla]